MNGQNRIVTTCQHDKIPGVFESSVRKPQVNASIVSPSVPGAVEADRTSNETPNKTNNHCPWSQHIDSWRQLAGSEIGRRSYVPLPDDCIAMAIKPFALQAGQLQYVNNQWLVHARAEFTDLEVAERGRHLVRIWNRRP